jgi:hypothetical protein
MEIIVTDIADAKNIKIYFKNLNAIRCIAAFLVIIHHIEQFKDIFHLPNHWNKSVGNLFFILYSDRCIQINYIFFGFNRILVLNINTVN